MQLVPRATSAPIPQIPADRRAPNAAWPVIRRAVDRRVPDGMRNLLVRTWQVAEQQRFEHTGSAA